VQSAVDAIAKSKWQLGPQETEEIFAKGASVMTPAMRAPSATCPAVSCAALDSKPGICPGSEVGGSPKRPNCNSGGVLQRAQPSELRRPVTEQNFTEGRVDPSNPEQFGCACPTPDVADANPVIGTGGPRNIQLEIKAVF
jgi:hypothetical protein